MAKPPRRHHLVPKFYLRRFSKEDRVRVQSRDLTKSFDTNVANASVRSHYYSIDLEDGSRSTAVETLLAEIEGTAAEVIRDLESGKIPFGEAREMFSLFMTLQMTRTQVQRSTLDEMGTAVLRWFLQIAPSDMARDIFVKEHGRQPTEG